MGLQPRWLLVATASAFVAGVALALLLHRAAGG
jgi:hypothetical protein